MKRVLCPYSVQRKFDQLMSSLFPGVFYFSFECNSLAVMPPIHHHSIENRKYFARSRRRGTLSITKIFTHKLGLGSLLVNTGRRIPHQPPRLPSDYHHAHSVSSCVVRKRDVASLPGNFGGVLGKTHRSLEMSLSWACRMTRRRNVEPLSLRYITGSQKGTSQQPIFLRRFVSWRNLFAQLPGSVAACVPAPYRAP